MNIDEQKEYDNHAAKPFEVSLAPCCQLLGPLLLVGSSPLAPLQESPPLSPCPVCASQELRQKAQQTQRHRLRPCQSAQVQRHVEVHGHTASAQTLDR